MDTSTPSSGRTWRAAQGATPPHLRPRSSISNLDFYRVPLSPGARSISSRTRPNGRKTPSPKRRTVKRRASVSILGSLVKSLKMKKARMAAAAVGRSWSRATALGQDSREEECTEEVRMFGLGGRFGPRHEEAELMDDLAQYLTMIHGNNPFKTPPQTPAGDQSEMNVSPPLSPTENSPQSMRSGRRERRSQLKSLQILGPEACGAVVEKWKKDRVDIII